MRELLSSAVDETDDLNFPAESYCELHKNTQLIGLRNKINNWREKPSEW